ncbi:MAG: nitroreductase family protein [Ilumatobacter sp.]
MNDTATFDQLSAVIRARRTSMFVDQDRPVTESVVSSLCELACWAPNHKKTWPWKFAMFTGEGRRTLGETMVVDMVAAEIGDQAKRLKTAGKYARTPAVLVVAAEPHDNAMLHVENRDSVAAGIQNLLLGATTLGLASFWSTPAVTSPPNVLDLCGFGAEDQIVGIVYLGWASSPAPATERPGVVLTHVTA